MKFFYHILALLIVLSGFFSCRDDDFSDSGDIVLEFSVDTLRFDTVFTERGSATYSMKVYNPSDENVRITSIEYADLTGFFRMNVDGISGNKVEDIPINAKDSIYLFCEVTIDPNSPVSESPFVIEDRIDFVTNGNQQSVHLEAWGQNANYFPAKSNQGNIALLTCDMEEIIWDDPKPYVIYGVVLVDSCVLRVSAGTRIFFHGGVVIGEGSVYNDGILYALPQGTFQFEGTVDDPITVADDRPEPEFDHTPGQWAGLRFGPLSKGHSIQHTLIYNSIVGIQMDSLSQASLEGVEIFNTSGTGITAVYSDLEMTNCLVYDNGGQSLAVIQGGRTVIDYCTFANFANQAVALSLSNLRCYDANCDNFATHPLEAVITNSLILGDDRDEISIQDATPDVDDDFDYTFDHCLYRAIGLEEDEPDFVNHLEECMSYSSTLPLFEARNEGDFHLDSLSQAENTAIPLPSISTDLDGHERDGVMPDAGCYESRY